MFGPLVADSYCQTGLYSDAPIPIADQHPLALTHLSLRADSAQLIPPGSLNGSARVLWSNTVNSESDVFLVDAETRVVELEVRYSLLEDVELNLRQPIVYRGGGVTDEAIDEWHQFFGLPRGPRSRLPYDTYDISGETDNLGSFALQRDGTGLGSTELTGKISLISDSQFSLALNAGVGLPTGADAYGHSGIDSSTMLLGLARYKEWSLHAGGGFLYYHDDSLENLRYRRFRGGGFIGFGYASGESWTWLLTASASSRLLENVSEYPPYQVYLDFGVRYRLSPKSLLEVTFRENPGPEDSTTDFTVNVGLIYGAQTSSEG